jgi:hypothetical protein
MAVKSILITSRGRTMKPTLLEYALLFSSLCACGSPTQNAEKILEDGVEVVINCLEPYKPKGQKVILELKKELSIDYSREDMANLGR